MRTLALAAILALCACEVQNDPAEDRVTVQYDEAKIKKSAATAGRAAKEVATGVANVAEGTGKAIKREVGDVDVDVKISRKRPGEQEPAPRDAP
jgi:predicted AAA+ superfamily ATPase